MTRQKVFIVEDEEMMRWMLTEAMRVWGYASVEVGSVAAGIAAFDSERPATVLLDINLPDGTGLELLREIKRHQLDAGPTRIRCAFEFWE